MRALIEELPEGAWEIAEGWHGGQSSMLYAILSTGDLTTGSIRPSTYDENNELGLPIWRQMTDNEWLGDLAFDLWRELADIQRSIAKRPDLRDETDELALNELADLAERSFDHWADLADRELTS